ncbi:amino acid adenylation domain-containing protein [Tolypothrix sp. FACHB-123]|uniref:non-ribosomal peptide synthetase n=1 Tax=Tolypothrix sp. FACHB-123 TaxID=2692868 RepID=UPI001682121C|nr:non-ribosomal peptide synthetase [Tolypothrix sp. FACHB-123]MBD2358634.1 amino acid adenylation domain-containing protein [Tolypothrix sp. FACHB-123]
MKTVDELLLELHYLNVKLWIEGNSLRYEALKETLSPKLLAQLREQEAEIVSILQQSDDYSEHLLKETTGFSPLSYGQQALWFIYQMAPESVANNIFLTARINSELDLEIWRKVWQKILNRHTILRTTYTIRNGQPVQRIHSHQEVNLEVIDASGWNEEYLKAQIYLATDIPFDLESGPVLRVKLFNNTTQGNIQLILMHHIAGDMWSLDLLLEELQILYDGEINPALLDSPSLPFPKYQYTDYVRWQNDLLATKQKKLWSYWSEQLAGELTILNLPSTRPYPGKQKYRGDSVIFKLDPELIKKLKQLAKTQRASIYTIMLAAFFALLYRYTGQEEILLGTPMVGRMVRKDFQKIVGYFTNINILRCYLTGNPTFKELLTQVRSLVIGAIRHQDAPFSLLIEELKIECDRTRKPLISTCFTWHKHCSFHSVKHPEQQAMRIEVLSELGVQRGGIFDIDLKIIEAGNDLHLAWEYSTDLFDRVTITKMHSHYLNLLEGIFTNPEQSLSNLPLLTACERHELLVDWHNNPTEYPQDKCIHELFIQQVELTPDAVAVVFAGQQLTYQQLNQKANQLAHYLQSLGVGTEILVGIYVEPSLWKIIGLLGILKAGGAYVPLDPSDNPENLKLILEATQLSVLLTQTHLIPTLPPHLANLICIVTETDIIEQSRQENPSVAVTSTNLAAVIYQASVNDKPKGINIIHRGVVHLLTGNNYTKFKKEEIFLQLAPLTFDEATLEIWGSLLNGARLVILPSHQPSLSDLTQAIHQHQVTTLWLRAGLFNLLVDEQLTQLKQLKQIFITNILSVAHVKKLLQAAPELKLINVYSVSENTTVTCCYLITDTADIQTTVPIGRPIGNTQIYLLDAQLQPVPVGIPGEIYISGDGLAKGYFQNPELTATAFIPHPFNSQPGAILYKTGDLARYLANGNIELLLRIDQQVKIRGYQIQITEPHLNLEPEHKEHKEYKFTPPRTPTEAVIADIIASILGKEEIGIHDNFFAVGGTSLLAMQVIFRLRQAYQLKLPWRCLFEAPTVAELEKLIISYRQTDLGQTVPKITPVSPNQTEFPLSFAQARLWLFDQLVGKNAIYNMPLAMRITGNLNINALERSIRAIIQHQASLRTNFQVVKGLTVQVVNPAPTVNLHLVNLQNASDPENEIHQLAKIEAHIPFDLAGDSLIRAKLLQLSSEDYVLLLTLHYIVCDRASLEILQQELSSLYTAECAGYTSLLPDLPIQYVDYTLWQWQLLSTQVLQRQIKYWSRQLAGVRKLQPLPTDKPRKSLPRFKGSSLQCDIDTQLWNQLKTLNQQADVTMFMTLLTAFVTLLYRYSDRQDILIGSPVANRHQNTQNLIGLFANILVLRIHIQENLSLSELLKQVKQVVSAAYAHQELPFEQLLNSLLPENSLSQNPLQIMFNVETAPQIWQLAELTVTPINRESTTAQTDLTLSIVETATGLKTTWEYNSDLFERHTIATMIDNFQSILATMAIALHQTVGEIPRI